MEKLISTSDKFKLIRLIKHLNKIEKLYCNKMLIPFVNQANLETCYETVYYVGITNYFKVYNVGLKYYSENGFLILSKANSDKNGSIKFNVDFDFSKLKERQDYFIGSFNLNNIKDYFGLFLSNFISFIMENEFIVENNKNLIEYISYIYEKINVKVR